ncbi:hypothetical protein C8F04DRAFT_1262283 [Mycena alexandri]|uniref:Uncharacterized protein n=1 Tax=Mycena alexandri TaxID=1745969 RepID=A0AAD6ST90_9AGAR|nr:hypothetical protein C8F04DRAFT_1262283 [Mycena alexandri]
MPVIKGIGRWSARVAAPVTRHIWTSPSSAFDGAEKLKMICNARAHGQFTVIPPMIAYACCQARTMLSKSEWTRKDGKYSYESLFNTVIIKLFENTTAPRTVDTLRGVPRTGADASDDEDEDSEAFTIAARSAASSESDSA